MLSESLFAAIAGPPIASRTDISKEMGIYSYQLKPSHAPKASFKKSSSGPNSLAISESHIFAAQEGKARVHVYSRQRGGQETTVSFTERISCLTLLRDVLLLGTVQGRLLLWEICTGRLISTPQCHLQAITCVAATPYHVLTGSEDTSVHVWSMSDLLELSETRGNAPHEVERTLSKHTGAVTSVAVDAGASVVPDTAMCVTASRDKTCVIWNYRTGQALRTLLFASPPLAMCLDPCGRGLHVSSEDGCVFALDFYSSGGDDDDGGAGAGAGGGQPPLLGSGSESSLPAEINRPLGTVDVAAEGPASCIAVTNDGTVLLTGHAKGKILMWPLAGDGHPSRVADVNAAVTNLVVEPLFPPRRPRTVTVEVVKPLPEDTDNKDPVRVARFEGTMGTPAPSTAFSRSLNGKAFPQDKLEAAILAMEQQPMSDAVATAKVQEENEALWKLVEEQRAINDLWKKTNLQGQGDS